MDHACLSPSRTRSETKNPALNNGRSSSSSSSRAHYDHYNDADFAKDMNALSMQERQKVSEDIHDVQGEIAEPEVFLQAKLDEFIGVLDNLSSNSYERAAWDRAVFLRPSLMHRDHLLIFLRARRFDAFHAATLLLKFYETKRNLGGDNLLIHNLKWEDMSEGDRSYLYRAVAIYLRPRQLKDGTKKSSRRLWYSRVSALEANTNARSFLRSVLYSFLWNLQDNLEFQRQGQIGILDLRGIFNMSKLRLMEFFNIVSRTLHTFPIHLGALHVLLEEGNTVMMGVAKSLQSMMHRDRRIRLRLHAGSWMEIQYSLRTFGIDIRVDWLEGDEVKGSPFSSDSIQEVLSTWRRKEEDQQRSEDAFCEGSAIALHERRRAGGDRTGLLYVHLYPKPQDFIMGKKRTVAPTWPGNLAYMVLIRQQVQTYQAANSNYEKTVIIIKTLQRLKDDYRVRFLTRIDNGGWEELSDEDARLKIGHSLRQLARKLLS